MLDFNQYITEIFDKVYSYTSNITKLDANYDFITKDNRKGNVYLRYIVNNDKKDNIYSYWGLEFLIDDNFHVLNKGDQFAIFSTVLDCIKDFINKKSPNEIRFSAADSDSRVSLYSTMVRKFANTNGYEFKETNLEHRFW